jgi:hypothetical protein
MSQTNPKRRDSHRQHPPQTVRERIEMLRISRSRGHDHTVDVRQNRFPLCFRRNPHKVRSPRVQGTNQGFLCPGINHQNGRHVLGPHKPNFLGQGHAPQAFLHRDPFGLCKSLCFVIEERARHGAERAQLRDETPRVHALDRRHALREQPLPDRLMLPQISSMRGVFCNHKTRHLNRAGFMPLFRHSVIPDEWIRQHQNLPAIGGVCQRLDIPRKAGVKHDLAACLDLRTKSPP